MINRAAIILRYKEAALRWMNEADPVVTDTGFTAADVDQDRTVYLIPEDVGEDDEAIDRWVRSNYQMLFELELQDWYGDPRLWPPKRSLALFNKWFAVECHSTIIDTVDGEIYDEED